MNPAIIGVAVLSALLVASAALNAWQYRHNEALNQEKAQAVAAAEQAQATGKACSDSVDNLAKDGKRRTQAVLAALQAESQRIKGLQHDALKVLQTQPANPKDLCASVELFLRDAIKAEREAGKK